MSLFSLSVLLQKAAEVLQQFPTGASILYKTGSSILTPSSVNSQKKILIHRGEHTFPQKP